jgi:hypothetical protein
MDEMARISAIAGPAPSEFPSGRRFLGIAMLQTRFPRPLGDIGNPRSFAVPVRARVVAGAVPDMIVQTAAGLRRCGITGAFQDAVRDLEREGAAAITTSCGFLVLLQQELQAAATVPVVTSSLLMLPELLERHRQVGVLTISAERLGSEFLLAAGVSAERLGDVLVEGVDPKGEFASAILGNREDMDLERAGQDVLAAAIALKRRAPHLTDVVLECTNMPPHAGQIEQATGLRTWSLLQSAQLLAPFA